MPGPPAHSDDVFQFVLRADQPDDTLISLFLSCPSPPTGLKTYLISGRKLESHSYCSCTQLGPAGHEHADARCPPSRVHTPDGAPSLPPDSVKVSAPFSAEQI